MISIADFKVNIGDLRNRITLQVFVTTLDDDGFETQEWQDLRTVWAKVENLHGREFYAAAAVQVEKTVKFSIRYIKDIDETMRIKFGKRTVNVLDQGGIITGTKEVDRVYDIKFIDNVKYDNRFIEIQALEVEVGG